MSHPTDIAWTPDGRMLVTSLRGRLYVFGVHGRRTMAWGVRPHICITGDRGLTSVAVDPDFRTNHYVYLYWTHNAHHSCGSSPGSLPEHRVTRVVLRDDDHAAKRHRKVIVDHIKSNQPMHNDDDLLFGADGYLYIGVGDGLCRIGDQSACAEANNNAQRLDLPQGKILRVTRQGFAPSSNPYADAAGAHRCTRPAGPQHGTGPCKEIYASGFRNPWRMARRPGTNEIFVGDVGLYTWEEIDRLRKRANYGWNLREGHCATGSTTNCGPTHFTNPLLDYRHDPCDAITGGAFVPSAAHLTWPKRYTGSYLFADLECNKIFRLVHHREGTYTRRTFLTGAGSPVDLGFGPFRHTRALYYVNFYDNTIHRVSYQP